MAGFPRICVAVYILAIHPENSADLSRGGSIDRIVIDTGDRAPIAKLPPFVCADASLKVFPSVALNIQDPGDFRIDRKKGWACITLMDRNINAASLLLDIRVDLKSGNVARHVSVGEFSCRPPDGVTTGAKAADTCGSQSRASATASQQKRYAFSFRTGNVMKSVKGRPQKVLRINEYEQEALSPSGRWALLSGDQSDGDYIHRQLVLLDRETGQIFPIHGSPGAWPSALEPVAGSSLRIEVPIANTIGVVGESDVRWLGTSAESEVLVIDDLIIVPRRESFSVNGAVAR
ncbi:MAG: hypothetical protein SF187_29885 [Deltaproteobacteria bacterium]|nr:hypothetical protein [Deltaproteobacteria bacterium]